MTSTAEIAPLYSLEGKKVFVAGHTGMVGSAILRRLQGTDCDIITAAHNTLDLTRQGPTENFHQRPQAGCHHHRRRPRRRHIGQFAISGGFSLRQSRHGMNLIRAAHQNGVERLLWLGSSCIYPRDAAQPLTEDALLTGPLEPTNEAYAIAKIAGLKYAEACARQYGNRFMTAMPTNLYGPNDNFDPESSHVLPALIRRIHEAKVRGIDHVTLWGSGKPLREFFCMWTTLPMPACTCCAFMTASSR